MEQPMKLKPYTEVVVRERVVGSDEQKDWLAVGPLEGLCERGSA
jgi:hypothetical protein